MFTLGFFLNLCFKICRSVCLSSVGSYNSCSYSTKVFSSSVFYQIKYKEILQRTHISTTQDIFSDETLVSNSEYAQKKGSYEFCTLLNNLRSAGATQRCVERGGAYDLFSSVSHGATTVLWLVHRLVSLRTFIRHLNGPNVSLPSTAGVPTTPSVLLQRDRTNRSAQSPIHCVNALNH